MKKSPVELTAREKFHFKAFDLMARARAMEILFQKRARECPYVYANSTGHEIVQIALGLQLKACDYLFPYYRDDAMLLALGISPKNLMLQLLAKEDDPFTSGRSYYAHSSINSPKYPKIIHQSSATGMQAIPATGLAEGLAYKRDFLSNKDSGLPSSLLPIVICSMGDGAVTEGEVSEAWQMAALKQLPILFLVQDNSWSISATSEEIRSMNAFELAEGFIGLKRVSLNSSDFDECSKTIESAVDYVRKFQRPLVLHAKVPLIGDHTSGVKKDQYREETELREAVKSDPFNSLKLRLIECGFSNDYLESRFNEIKESIEADFESALNSPDPKFIDVENAVFAESLIVEEVGKRETASKDLVLMVDAAVHAIDELLTKHPEAILYGQDVGSGLGGVFREAYQLAEKHGTHRVFNSAIQEAYILGSTVGMSAVGIKPIVEIQFGDYFWPAFNQLVVEMSKSYFLSAGKYPVQSLIRVPVGAYGGGGPYHSASIESTLLSIKGVKVVYPSNAADLKGLLKSSFYDPNPVIILEHKGLYWSKVPGTQNAARIEPAEDYIIPLGKAAIALEAYPSFVEKGNSVAVISYGMGVHWAINSAAKWPGQVEVLDLRTLCPLDWKSIESLIKKHNKVLLLTEETKTHSFLQSLAGRIAEELFSFLDAAPKLIGSLDLPAVPLSKNLEVQMLPSLDEIELEIERLLTF